MKRMMRVLGLSGLLFTCVAHGQSTDGPTAGTLDVRKPTQQELRAAVERAKQLALTQLRALGGAAAAKADQLQGLPPAKFLERMAVFPPVGQSTIGAPKPGEVPPSPSVNASGEGGATTAHPGVALLLAKVGGQDDYAPRCSGTLIRQNVVLTAAHCVCYSKNANINYETGKECINGSAARGPSSLMQDGNWQVFFQHAGLRAVKKVIVHDGYVFGATAVRNDLALLVLTQPVTDINPPSLPAGFNPASKWSAGEVVGFGYSAKSGSPAIVLWQLAHIGLKAGGPVTAASCVGPSYLDPAGTLCTIYAPNSGGSTTATCEGDSGGPLRMMDQFGTTIGVTSGRVGENCAASNTLAFQMATSYLSYHDWIETNLQGVASKSVTGRWPAFGDNLRSVADRRNSVPFDELGIYKSEAWMVQPEETSVLATINSTGAINEFSVRDRNDKVLCRGQAGKKTKTPNVDYCSLTAAPGMQFRIVAKGDPAELLQYVVSTRVAKK